MVAAAGTQPLIRRHPTLRVLLTAEVISMVGTQFSAIAMPWLALQVTGSARAMGLVMAALLAAIAGCGFFGASWVGRVGPRRVMLLGDLLRGPLVALLPLLHILGLLNLGVFMAVMFAVGAFSAPYLASQQTILPMVVGEDAVLLSRATAALQTATRLSILIGPPLAGVLIAVLNTNAVLLLDGVSFLVSAVLLWRHLPRATPPPPTGPRRFGTGLRTLLSDRLVATWSVGLSIGELVWQALFALLPVIALTREHGSSVLSGVLLATFGGGAFIGTLLVGPLLRRLAARTVAVVGRLALGLAFIALLRPPSLGTLIACLAIVGLLNGVSSAPVTAVRALRIPADRRAEGLTVAMALALAAGAAGWALAGAAAQDEGLPATFRGLVILQLAAAALFVFGALGPGDPAKV